MSRCKRWRTSWHKLSTPWLIPPHPSQSQFRCSFHQALLDPQVGSGVWIPQVPWALPALTTPCCHGLVRCPSCLAWTGNSVKVGPAAALLAATSPAPSVPAWVLRECRGVNELVSHISTSESAHTELWRPKRKPFADLEARPG